VTTQISYGDNVRIRRTPETERLGLAETVGNVYGETTPSESGVSVVGELTSDHALNVYFENLDASYWLSPQLLEFEGHAPGTEVHVHGSPFKSVRQRDGTWKDVPASPEPSTSLHRPPVRAVSWLVPLLLVYTLASLLHFVHNAEYLAEYPNLPASFSRASVYGAWLVVVAIGIAGYALYRSGWPRTGLLMLGLYAALGLDGLLHYTRAPLGAHTGMMNFTIWFEVVAAIALLFVLHRIFRSTKP